ncbi:hypothetical protein Tco_0047014 [Tanacetum coccineum]
MQFRHSTLIGNLEEKQESLAEEHAANPFEPSPVSYFYNADYDNISTPSTSYTIHLTKSATIITNPSELKPHIYHNNDIFYDGDDNEELFPDEVKRIQQILERTSFDAITPDFLITDSLSMGDEHFSTISKTELDELIKSSVENLVPTPSESKDLSKDLSDNESECSVPVCDDFTTVSNPLFDADNDFSSSDDKIRIHLNDESLLFIESLLNRDTLIISSPKFDSLLEEFSGELAHIDLIPPGINEADVNPEEDIRLVEKMDIDSLMEEINLFLTPDYSMPSGIENDDYDSEGDILFLEELLSNDSLSLPENESFHFDVHHPLDCPELMKPIMLWFCPSFTEASNP